MTEVLFFLSVGFIGYVAYVLVDEQRRANPGPKLAPIVNPKSSITKAPRKTATAKKAKSVSATKSPAAAIKKTVAKPLTRHLMPYLRTWAKMVPPQLRNWLVSFLKAGK
jgi:hypothetical protein